MPSTLGKNLHMCFTKAVCDSSSSPAAPLNNPDHAAHHSRPFIPSSSSSSSIFIRNFNSLYDYDSTSNSKLPSARTHSSSTLSSDPDSESEPDFATVVASQRFFFTSPGRSNSIVESTPSVATTTESSDSVSPMNNHQSGSSTSCVRDSVAVPTDSPDPYVDFRRSMQEMVEARDLFDVKANWDCLHELLLCYLALNPKTTHKFIISAFADLLVSLMSPPDAVMARRR